MASGVAVSVVAKISIVGQTVAVTIYNEFSSSMDGDALSRR